jgi:alpha-beta hydrolase superfamily lysophospholipase
MSKLPKFLIKLLIAPAVLVAIVFTLALVMILWGDPEFTAAPDLSPEKLAASGISFEQPYPVKKRSFRMRDGTVLTSQYLPTTVAGPKTTIVYVHGVLSSSFPLNRSSGMLREAATAEVVAIDLRGHGFSGGKPGDTDYIGQYEDDLGDVIKEIRAGRPEGKVILAGHSMGGGIALRYAMRSDLPPVDGYLLFAPYLGWTSPTTRKEPPAEAEAGAEFMKIHLPRILGLKLLNTVGIRAFNGLRTQFYNLPPALPLRSYSYRASEGMAPEDYRPALAAVRAPLLVVVGSRDEAFIAEAYEGVIRGNRRGTVTLIPEATHNGVLQDARAMAAVTAWEESHL